MKVVKWSVVVLTKWMKRKVVLEKSVDICSNVMYNLLTRTLVLCKHLVPFLVE